VLKLTPSIFAELRQHGEQTYPLECCGILLGTADLERNERAATLAVRCGNTRTDSAHNRYNIHPKELIAAQKLARQRGEDIVGFYHSHPDHPAEWSPTDLAEAHWIGCSYVITAVAKGKAAQTNSFALAGTVEEDKRFAAEPVVISGSAAASAETPPDSSPPVLHPKVASKR
jgi:proteasome lid subunit RPN8/RPN11